MSSLALSGGGLSVTAPMHGSNSTSSLVSLDHLSDAALLDDDSHAISIADSSPTQRPLPPRPLLLTHDDSDDSDDESQTHRRTPSPPLFSPSPPPFASPAAPSTVALLASARIRTGSCTTRDMAVEMAHIAREASRRESSALPSFSIRLVDTDGLDLGVLPPDADDVFSLETFATLHQQRRAMGRQLIIAQVTTKDKNRAAVNSAVYSYYDAFPLLKVLYKVHASSMGIRLSHRYHQYSAMNPINPLTNTCIIGDVRFFITEAVDGPHSAPVPALALLGGRSRWRGLHPRHVPVHGLQPVLQSGHPRSVPAPLPLVLLVCFLRLPYHGCVHPLSFSLSRLPRRLSR